MLSPATAKENLETRQAELAGRLKVFLDNPVLNARNGITAAETMRRLPERQLKQTVSELNLLNRVVDIANALNTRDTTKLGGLKDVYRAIPLSIVDDEIGKHLGGLKSAEAGIVALNAERIGRLTDWLKVGELGPKGREAIGLLKDTLRHREPSVVLASLKATAGIGPDAKELIPSVAALLEHADRPVVLDAARVLGHSLGRHAAHFQGVEGKDFLPGLKEAHAAANTEDKLKAARENWAKKGDKWVTGFIDESLNSIRWLSQK